MTSKQRQNKWIPGGNLASSLWTRQEIVHIIQINNETIR